MSNYGDKRIDEGFWKLTKVDANGCWIWLGSANKYGYGNVKRRLADGPRKTRPSHRYAYLVLVGEVPLGLELDHLCRVPACCNPNHLEPVTHRVNAQRRDHVRTTCREGHPLHGPNLYVSPVGHRKCRTCVRAKRIAWNERLGREAYLERQKKWAQVGRDRRNAAA